MNILKKVKFEREAILFDTPFYLVKTFLSVLTAYILFSKHTIVGRDMISLLFGMMLTLEPVNYTGMKGGFFQVKSSIIGGVLTATIIALFGVNFITVPLAVMLTMYVTLKMNWREISVVAMFTSIYMTQYIQLDSMGNASMVLTLRLRLMALGAGVLVAMFYNFVFSKLTYRKFAKKRTLYLLERLNDEFLKFKVSLDDPKELRLLKRRLSAFFTDFDFILSHLEDIKHESEKHNINFYIELVRALRDFNHYFLDLLMDHMLEPLTIDQELLIIEKQLVYMIQCIRDEVAIESFKNEVTEQWKFKRIFMTLSNIVEIKWH